MNNEKEYITIIKDVITKNKRYAGNEDLLDAFCQETEKRTNSIVSLLKDEEKIVSYIVRVSNSAVIKVLKDNNRLGVYRIPHSLTDIPHVEKISPVIEEKDEVLPAVAQHVEVEKVSSINEAVVAEEISPVVEEKDEVSPAVAQHVEVEKVPSINEAVVAEEISPVVEEKNLSSSDILEQIASNLYVLNTQNPAKQYYMIYKLRYIERMKNKDIAKNMNISEADVTSRLLELSDNLKKCFNY